MPLLAGRPGSWGGLVLRVGQASFAAGCIGVMGSSFGFASYTAFCYLIASMGLQTLWSLGLACLDGYAIKAKKDLTSPILLSLFVVGDWVTAILSFAASCSAGGVVVLFERDVLFCRRYPQLPCGRYGLATAFAFLSWALSATSALIMFWLLAAF
ncbi:CASP-like protein 5B2 [Phragmites australis]|uniref:CASP-like protein 5B2 n=1 Tax=Phragmites australis TaxID=29695 RepID=UPI002D7733DA|nr:CASP-like protein 5B2 [Phragmites australis]